MMGIPYEDCCYIFSDNQSVLVNSSKPDSRLKKKSNSVAYHFIREGTARDEWRFCYIESKDNPSDLATKILPDGGPRKTHVQNLLRWI